MHEEMSLYVKPKPTSMSTRWRDENGNMCCHIN